MRKNVSDLLWGYEEKLFKAGQFFADPPPFEKYFSYFSQIFSIYILMFRFGLFLDRDTSNESLLGEYTIHTGEGDPYKLGTVHSYNGNTEMSNWNDSHCDKVHET